MRRHLVLLLTLSLLAGTGVAAWWWFDREPDDAHLARTLADLETGSVRAGLAGAGAHDVDVVPDRSDLPAAPPGHRQVDVDEKARVIAALMRVAMTVQSGRDDETATARVGTALRSQYRVTDEELEQLAAVSPGPDLEPPGADVSWGVYVDPDLVVEDSRTLYRQWRAVETGKTKEHLLIELEEVLGVQTDAGLVAIGRTIGFTTRPDGAFSVGRDWAVTGVETCDLRVEGVLTPDAEGIDRTAARDLVTFDGFTDEQQEEHDAEVVDCFAGARS